MNKISKTKVMKTCRRWKLSTLFFGSNKIEQNYKVAKWFVIKGDTITF